MVDSTKSPTSRRGALRTLAGGLLLGPILGLFEETGARAWAQRTRQQVMRSLRLRPVALRALFPEGSWLATYRDVITRAGDWRALTIDDSQKALVQGSVRVIGPTESVPVGQLLGFGSIDRGASGLFCAVNACGSLAAASSCDKQICTNQNCTGNECGGQVCAGQECPGNICNGQRAGLMDFVSEIESQWDHPFVQDLRRQFQVSSANDLADAVNRFVATNGYVAR